MWGGISILEPNRLVVGGGVSISQWGGVGRWVGGGRKEGECDVMTPPPHGTHVIFHV